MRELKFRVWAEAPDGENGMHYPKLISFGGSGQLSWATLKDDSVLKDNGWYTKREVMQYTGLKDKNGVEIYEGDIVRVSGIITGAEGLRPGFVWSDDDVFVIAWDEDIAAWSVQDEDFDTTDVVSVTYRNQAIQLIQNGSGEVIGNIYENPELLTQGSDLADEGRKPI